MGISLGDIGKAASVVGNVATLPAAAALNAFGVDTTPGYSAANVIKTQAGNIFGGTSAPANTTAAAKKPAATPGGQADATQPSGNYSAGVGGSGTSATPVDLALYQSQLNDLNDLLGRTDTKLNQGLGQLNDSYQSNVNQQQSQENQALQDYTDKRTQTNKDKLGAYDTINKNANNGYRSLAQIIGRSAGTGSSAFQDLLPDVIGKDTSSKRGDANQTYASNLGNIDTAQKKTENSFANILADLANQRNAQEQQLRTGVEGQRQSIAQQQQTAAANLAAAKGGNPLQAAQAYQPAIENSRNAVDSFFNQFKPTVTAQQAAVAAPDLSQYTVDRSNVNANQQGSTDPTNPYADILRKKLQEQAV